METSELDGLTEQITKRDGQIMKLANEVIRLNQLVKEKQEVIDLLDRKIERIRNAVG